MVIINGNVLKSIKNKRNWDIEDIHLGAIAMVILTLLFQSRFETEKNIRV
jgi:hypothetical protein